MRKTTPAGKMQQTGRAALAVALLAFPLGGCIDQASDLQAASVTPAGVPVGAALVRRADVSPGGAALALASLEGPPPALSARFVQALVAAAGPREIVLAEAARARYLARGYLTTYPVEGGIAFEYVWDVFENGKARAQRLNDAVVVKGSGGAEAWSLATDQVLASLAAKSADELAAFLSNTPEAAAAARVGRPTVASAGAALKPLGYAPAN